MYRVLIAEDEDIIRKGIAYTMDWVSMGCTIVGEAANGKEGIEKIKELSPDIVLADEPTANLDSINGDQILELMQKLNHELKTTFIFSTHDQKIVNMATQIIKIRDGKVL